MINFIQLHQTMLQWEYTILTDDIYRDIDRMLSEGSIENFIQFMYNTSVQYNIDQRNILKNYFNYKVRAQEATTQLLHMAENILHTAPDTDMDDIMRYVFSRE